MPTIDLLSGIHHPTCTCAVCRHERAKHLIGNGFLYTPAGYRVRPCAHYPDCPVYWDGRQLQATAGVLLRKTA